MVAESEPADRLLLGVVLECKVSRSPWTDHIWQPVGIIVGGLPLAAGTVLRSGDGWRHCYAGDIELELFRKETEGYKRNLSSRPPVVYVVMRSTDQAMGMMPVKVTVCPYEAERYLVSGDELVEGVPMPDQVGLFVQEFVARHHVDEPFRKRIQRPKHEGGVGGGDVR